MVSNGYARDSFLRQQSFARLGRMTTNTAPTIPRALLVSIRTPDLSESEAAESVRELERLVTTLGFRVIGTQTQNRPSTTSATAVGAGKLHELARLTGGKGAAEENPEDDEETVASDAPPPDELATVVVFDCDLKPSQLRHIENALGVEVLDRTGVIIEIFSRHAKTRSARLQVEIARLNYIAPRLRETGSSGERQSGRGSGESALATERRAIRDRLAELKRELAHVQESQAGHRRVRSSQPTVALVGYTNAGKSSTMRALTGSEVLVEDKLFATLDTTVRSLKPESHPRILVSDTVGFIKKLPHDLMASFRSTLDEALNASLLLYVVDASDPTFRSQLEVVDEVLREVGVKGIPSLLVLNKSDLIDEATQKLLQREFRDAIFVRTQSKESIKALRDRILVFFEKDMVEEQIFAPYALEGIIGELRASVRILSEKHEDEGTRYTVRAKLEELARLKKKFDL
jgi:GTP-binding protein HflX